MKFPVAAFLALMLVVPAASYAQQPQPPAESIHVAALKGNLGAVRQHIAAGTDLNARDAYGSTPLSIAITFANPDVARALIEAGADLATRSKEGSTPLHLATFFARTGIVRALLNKGADRFARNNSGSTAYDVAAAPFADDKALYDAISQALAPFGLKFDYGRIAAARPEIAALLRPGADALAGIDYAPKDAGDWPVSTPGAEGLDPQLVAELYLDAAHLDTIYSLLVVRNGRLVAERYFNKGAPDQQALLQSATKSYISALLGIARERGCIPDLDGRMLDYFPELAGRVKDPRKREITLRQLLQMRSGYPWEETDPALWAELMKGDTFKLLVDVPLVADPGAQFNYSNLTANILAVIVARACDTDLLPFAEEHMFSPLGAGVGTWWQDKKGYRYPLIHVTARDAAKFGLLYLDGGRFGGKQIVPAEWVADSLRAWSDDAWIAIRQTHAGRYFRDLGYGYQWWSAMVDGRRFDFAWGHGGQLIVLLHELDMVVAVTADPFWGRHDDTSWRHEQSVINLVGKFIASLPK